MTIHLKEVSNGGTIVGIQISSIPLVEGSSANSMNGLANSGFRVSVELPGDSVVFPKTYVPYVGNHEASQKFIDTVNSRHLLSGTQVWKKFFDWPYEQTYSPVAEKPFNLAGYPLHDKKFWDNFKGNIIELGSGLIQDWSYRPWSNVAAKPFWSGYYYKPTVNYQVSGTIPHTSGFLYYGRPNKEDFNQYIPNGPSVQPIFFNAGGIREYRWAQKLLPRSNYITNDYSCVYSGVGHYVTTTSYSNPGYVLFSVTQSGLST
jgi:hypothetical protein